MKVSHYDVLQVSAKAIPEVIKAAYQKLKPVLSEAAQGGDHEARNQLLFLEEAYLVLSSPEKRAAYDVSLTAAPVLNPQPVHSYAYQSESTFLSWWLDSRTGRLMIGIALIALAYSAYKFMGQRGDQQIRSQQVEVQSVREVGTVRNEAYRAESERFLVEGAVQNQGKMIDIASEEAARRKAELDYRANASAKSLELQQQRLDAQLQQQRWAQEQYEKDRERREAKALADAPKKQLCNMYALNGNVRDARAAGCY